MRSRAAAALVMVVLLASASRLAAQTSTGEVNGTVTDSTGAVIPGATVTLTNQGTKIARTAVTNASGNFVFINVPSGTYTLSIELQGFKTVQVSPFDIAVNQTLTRSVRLEVGAVTEALTVTAEAPLLQRSSSELGTVITEKAVHDLPLNGRNFTQLLTLTPGATPVSTAQGSGISSQDAAITGIPGSSFSKPAIHGQENRSTLYYMDGIFNTDLRGPVYGVLPIVDVIEEFKVQAHNDKTEFGGVTGGVVNIVSKSGTNDFHGSGWEFLRSDLFDARDPFKESTRSSPAPYKQNEFGGTVGGPLVKNRTFFYAGYEGWRYTKPAGTLGLVPTDAELNGDFTQSVLRQNIFNPFSQRADPANPVRTIRDRFMCDGAGNPLALLPNGMQPAGTPCNRIPAALISPSVQGLLKTYLASPNYSGTPGLNYIENRVLTDNNDGWQIKVDHRFRDSDNAFFRLSQMFVHHLDPVTGTQEFSPSDYHAYNYGGNWDHIIRSNLFLSARGGALSKPYVFNNAKANAGIDPLNRLGFADVNKYQGLVVTLAAPWITPPGTTSIGNLGDSIRDNPDWQVGGDLTWFKNNHNVKFGGQYIYAARLQINTSQTYGFSNSVTGDPNSQGNTGNSVASALLGLPASFGGQLPDLGEVHFKLGTWSAYVQDEWRLKPQFTLNWGVRYDLLTQPRPLNNRLSNALDIPHQQWLIGAGSIPDCKQVQQNPCFPGNGFQSIPFNNHIVFVGKTAFQPKPVYDNIGPRVGMAWELNPRTVLRAGYGLYWDALPARSQYTQNDIEGTSWPWTTAFNGNANNVGAPLTPISAINGSFPVPVAAASPFTSINGAFADDPNYKDGFSNQWNVEVQRELTPTTTLSVAYVGSHNGRLAYTGYANAAPTPSPQGTSLAVIDSLRPMPFMNANVHYTQSIGASDYRALQTRLQRRLANGLMTLVSYTWSKATDNTSGYFGVEDGAGSRSSVQNYFDPASNVGPSGFDIPHFLSWYAVWELPVGQGKRWLSTGPASWVLGNWSVNSIFQARSGQPFNVGISGDFANIGGTGPSITNYERPNLVGNPIPAHQTAAMWFDPTAFQVPSGAFGNFQRNGLRSAAFYNVDLSLFKNVPFGGARHLQLRVEAFNVFNIQNLGTPTAAQATIAPTLAAGTGAVTQIVGNPRQIQLGARFVF